ncbi:IS3 family transposase [Clostridium perfringens]|uniref:IS3 family transposase n=1 Tax=Clostridium perfringens TaxID=1502 RepID=UPI0037547B30|nr:IS3 family transposase [Clostridium perfringens]
MYRKENCYDNACIEIFFRKLKIELIYQNKYDCKEELFNDIEKYIAWYKTYRFQSKLKTALQLNTEVQLRKT